MAFFFVENQDYHRVHITLLQSNSIPVLLVYLNPCSLTLASHLCNITLVHQLKWTERDLEEHTFGDGSKRVLR
jgi:hypothetical protein